MLSWPPVGSTNSNEIAPESEYKSSFSFLVSCISRSCSQWSSNVRTLKSNVKIADSAKRYMESSYNWSAGRICWCANTSDDNKTVWFKILKLFLSSFWDIFYDSCAHSLDGIVYDGWRFVRKRTHITLQWIYERRISVQKFNKLKYVPYY